MKVAAFIFYFYICCVYIGLTACSNDARPMFPAKTFNDIRQYSAGKASNTIVYYFDGDCSFCIAKMKFLEDSLKTGKKNTELVFLAQTNNPEVLKFNASEAHIKNSIHIDSLNSFEGRLKLNQVLELFSDGSYRVIEIK